MTARINLECDHINWNYLHLPTDTGFVFLVLGYFRLTAAVVSVSVSRAAAKALKWLSYPVVPSLLPPISLLAFVRDPFVCGQQARLMCI